MASSFLKTGYIFCSHLWGRPAVCFIKSRQTPKVPMQDCGLWERLICTREQRSCGRAHQCTHSRMRSISILHHIDPRAPWYSPPWTAWMACEWRRIALRLRILSGRMLSPSFRQSVCLLALGSSPCSGRTWVEQKIGCLSTVDRFLISEKCLWNATSSVKICKATLVLCLQNFEKRVLSTHLGKLWGWGKDRKDYTKPRSLF